MLKNFKILFLSLIISIFTLGRNVMAEEKRDTIHLTLKDGILVIETRPDLAPKHVTQIKKLINEGRYNDVVFHRVIEGFMAQGGDRTNGVPGNPGYYFDNEFHPDARHDGAGVISMANKGIIDGNGTNGLNFQIK